MKEHNLFCKRARGHERSEIKQTTVAKEAFVNVKTHHWLVSNSTSGILGHFASFAVPPDILTLFLTVIQLGLDYISEGTFTATKCLRLFYFAKPRLFHGHKSSIHHVQSRTEIQQSNKRDGNRSCALQMFGFGNSNRFLRDT